jgi:manganese oxidase
LKALRVAGLAVASLAVFGPAEGQPAAKTSSSLKVHTYYIAADEVQWNYLPTAPTHVLNGERELGQRPRIKSNTYRKAVYHEYTDNTFTTLKPRPPEWEHLGILGPLIRAEVGDVVKVVFKNNLGLVCTMHPHGLAYDKESEGAYYSDAAGAPPNLTRKGDAVHKGEVFTYTWTVPETAGPGPGDPSSILWMYHSHFVESRDMNSGLLGPIIVSKRVRRNPTARPATWTVNLWWLSPFSTRAPAATS